MASSAFPVPAAGAVLEVERGGDRAAPREPSAVEGPSSQTRFASYSCTPCRAWSTAWTLDASEALTACTAHNAHSTIPRGYTGNDLPRLLHSASPHIDACVPLTGIDLAASAYCGEARERVCICEDSA